MQQQGAEDGRSDQHGDSDPGSVGMHQDQQRRINPDEDRNQVRVDRGHAEPFHHRLFEAAEVVARRSHHREANNRAQAGGVDGQDVVEGRQDALALAIVTSELSRHLHFSAGNDLSDIVTMDWPSVRAEVEAWIFDGDDPIAVDVADLGALVATKPTGPVPTVVDWSRLDAEAFERLVFELIQSAEGYENATLLMKTNAPDRGRDVGAYRLVTDSLSGPSRSRLMVRS